MMRRFLGKTFSFRRFAKDEEGNGTIEFVIALPLFMLLFSFAVEGGVLATRQVMLEHGLDQTVREVRIGKITHPTHENLIERICDFATVIPDCVNQVRLQMIAGEVSGFDGSALAGEFECRDREEEDTEPLIDFTNTGTNNELMFLRACALFDPMLLYMGLGEVIPKKSENAYALVASSGYVMEPFK